MAKRVVVHVNGGVAFCRADAGVDVEVIDWDCIGSGDHDWTAEQVDDFLKRFAGLITEADERGLRAACQPGGAA
jgi:hypothetical protein